MDPHELSASATQRVESSVDAERYENDHSRQLIQSQTFEASQTHFAITDTDDNTASHVLRPFHPFFIVVEDSTTGEHHHPYVHYVFSDDDQDLMTNAIIHKLSPSVNTDDNRPEPENRSHGQDAPNDRIVILDIDDTGRNVVAAQSLNKDWQIVQTHISAAPTFDNSAATADSGLMLRIEGVEQQRSEENDELNVIFSPESGQTDEELLTALNALSSRFHNEQSMLQKIIDSVER